MSVKLPTGHHLEFQSLKGGCTGSSESTLVKIPHCWKSHVAAHLSTTRLAWPGYTLYALLRRGSLIMNTVPLHMLHVMNNLKVLCLCVSWVCMV